MASNVTTADRKKVLNQFKMSKGCADCGYAAHPAALDFDHLPEHEKAFTIAAGAKRHTMMELWAEVEKCEVVCANCHRIRTWVRRQDK